MRVSFFCIFFLFTISSFAQKGWELGGWIGISNYFGDLNTSIKITDPGPAFGVVGRYNFNERTCFKMSVNYGFIYANDANSRNNFEVQQISFPSVVDLDLTGTLYGVLLWGRVAGLACKCTDILIKFT